MRAMTDDEVREVANELWGTCQCLDRVLESLGYDAEPEDVMDRINDMGVMECLGCGWWFEEEALEGAGEDDDFGYCDACRRRLGGAR